MKTVNELLQQKPVYLGDWKEKFDVIANFDDIFISKDEYEAIEAPYANKEVWAERKADMKEAIERWININVLFAYYSYEDYHGEAFVLLERDGKLYEVNGSHCSCYGLEGQFDPEETSIEALAYRITDGRLGVDYDGANEFQAELKIFLGI